MADIEQIEKTPLETLPDEFVRLCRSIEAKRPRTVIEHILKHGIISNEELSDLYHYDHAPRAIRDVRENGIPLITHMVLSPKTGRRMGAYTFDDVSKIKKGRIGGRNAFSKKFRQELLDLYGSQDAVTGTKMEDRYLQIDHRIPYEIGGDDSDKSNDLNPKDFMLLDASSNRAKSWSCEHCENFLKGHDVSICKMCFWAYPEDYDHIAGAPSRRIDIVWTGDEVKAFDALKEEATQNKLTFAEFLKYKLSK